VTFIDSTILAEVIRAQQQVDANSGEELAIVAPRGGFAARLFDLVGLRSRCAMFDSQADALASVGHPGGKPQGRIPVVVRERIVELRTQGMSRRGIAELFNRQGIPTAAGGKRWYASTIQRVLDSAGIE
jgi:hypothetical protein